MVTWYSNDFDRLLFGKNNLVGKQHVYFWQRIYNFGNLCPFSTIVFCTLKKKVRERGSLSVRWVMEFLHQRCNFSCCFFGISNFACRIYPAVQSAIREQILFPTGFFYVKKPKSFLFNILIKTWVWNPSHIFDLIKPWRKDYLPSQ